MNNNRDFMKRALSLAVLAKGKTSPNPLVGAVVVKDGKIVGEGYHLKAGTPHAEVLALRQAGEEARGAELYVSLEPCCHYGKTPPCTQAIIAAGIKRVIVACKDPNPKVAGKGLAILREAGIAVEAGVLEEEARLLNEVFFKYIATGMPFVTFKTAMSLDGKIATSKGESKWITGEEARNQAHRLRAEHDAVLVGISTVIADDPLLTVRISGDHKQPLRVVVDTKLRMPLNSQLVQTAAEFPTVIAAGCSHNQNDKLLILREKGVSVWELSEGDGRVDLLNLFAELGKKEITSVLLEGGATLNSAVLKAGFVDKFIFFLAPKIIGGAAAPGPIGGSGIERLEEAYRVSFRETARFGEDLMITCYPEK